MSQEIDELKKMWQDSKVEDTDRSPDTSATISMAKKQMRASARLQLTTVIILMVVAGCLWVFFAYVAKIQETLSHIGAFLMLGGLVVRIFIEFYSIYLSTKIDLTEPAIDTNNASLAYYSFRKTVNGPVTVVILIVYTIGFYMLTPEFSLYFTTPVLILIDLSYLVAAFIFISSIRYTVRKEMKVLSQVVQITEYLARDQ